MKNNGLKNRFSQAVRYVWLYWYSCMVCGKNQQDNLHHIVSSGFNYIDGKHNESVYNSCPIHNRGCHIGNETWLVANTKELLWKTRNALEELGYTPNALDLQFLETYSELYG